MRLVLNRIRLIRSISGDSIVTRAKQILLYVKSEDAQTRAKHSPEFGKHLSVVAAEASARIENADSLRLIHQKTVDQLEKRLDQHIGRLLENLGA